MSTGRSERQRGNKKEALVHFPVLCCAVSCALVLNALAVRCPADYKLCILCCVDLIFTVSCGYIMSPCLQAVCLCCGRCTVAVWCSWSVDYRVLATAVALTVVSAVDAVDEQVRCCGDCRVS